MEITRMDLRVKKLQCYLLSSFNWQKQSPACLKDLSFALLCFNIWEVNRMTIWLKRLGKKEKSPVCLYKTSPSLYISYDLSSFFGHVLAFICCGWTKVRPKKTIFLFFHSYNHISLNPVITSANSCEKKEKKSK